MADGGFRHLVVLREGDVVGIISMRDLIHVWRPAGARARIAERRTGGREQERRVGVDGQELVAEVDPAGDALPRPCRTRRRACPARGRRGRRPRSASSSSAPSTPRSSARSAGPTKSPSTPSTVAIASAASRPARDSIIGRHSTDASAAPRVGAVVELRARRADAARARRCVAAGPRDELRLLDGADLRHDDAVRPAVQRPPDLRRGRPATRARTSACPRSTARAACRTGRSRRSARAGDRRGSSRSPRPP